MSHVPAKQLPLTTIIMWGPKLSSLFVLQELIATIFSNGPVLLQVESTQSEPRVMTKKKFLALSSWVGSNPSRTFRSIREEFGCEFLWIKPCEEQPSSPVIHPHHPWVPIHGISLMRVEMSAMIHSERRRETGHRTKGFYAACLVFPTHLYSGCFVTWLVDPLTHSHMWKKAQFA